MGHQKQIVVIVGPTAGGKSDLAIAIAQAFAGEVIGADSMQVYRYLDAGTAKPSSEQLAAVPHHLINVVAPTEKWTVADWLQSTEQVIADLHASDRLPVVVGGTNLYIKALLQGLFDGPEPDPAYREQFKDVPAHDLHKRLQQVDPASADRINLNDHKRIVRALEVFDKTGRPISDFQQQWSDDAEPRYRQNPILIGLRWETETINRRINARVKTMFHPTDGSEDLVTETRRLLDAGLLGPQAREAIGTKQVLAHFNRVYSCDEAMEKVKIETRRFAKAQRTWLKRFRGVQWLDVDDDTIASAANTAVEIVRQRLNVPGG